MSQMINPSIDSGGMGNASVPYLLTQIWQADAEAAQKELAALDSTQWSSPAAAAFCSRTADVRLALGSYVQDLREVMACVVNLDRALAWAAVKPQP